MLSNDKEDYERVIENHTLSQVLNEASRFNQLFDDDDDTNNNK